jgi:putative FmdB family regulatory protein
MTYDYRCRCGYKFEDFNRIENRHTAQCPHCGRQAKMVFSPPRAVHVFQPYWDPHIGQHGPVYIESRSQKKRLLVQQGLEQL